MKRVYKDYEDIPLAFNPETLGEIMGVSRTTAYQLANSPGFPKMKAGKRIIIEKASFMSWLKSKVEVNAQNRQACELSANCYN